MLEDDGVIGAHSHTPYVIANAPLVLVLVGLLVAFHARITASLALRLRSNVQIQRTFHLVLEGLSAAMELPDRKGPGHQSAPPATQLILL